MLEINKNLFWKITILMVFSDSILAEIGIQEFKKQQIVPDLIKSVPQSILNVTYDVDIKVNLGNVLTPRQVQNQPDITWDANSDNYYTLIMTDPDVPTGEEPRYRAQHYIVGNIPGNKFSEGNVLTEYIGAAPGKEGGLHKYIFLVYEQPNILNFEEKKIKKDIDLKRLGFSTQKFSEKYGLGEPIAGNFFQAEWDDYVPELYAELTGNTIRNAWINWAIRFYKKLVI